MDDRERGAIKRLEEAQQHVAPHALLQNIEVRSPWPTASLLPAGPCCPQWRHWLADGRLQADCQPCTSVRRARLAAYDAKRRDGDSRMPILQAQRQQVPALQDSNAELQAMIEGRFQAAPRQ